MKDDEKPVGMVDIIAQADGTLEVEAHGADCARTQEVYEAFQKGEAPRHPREERAARCGPAQVATEAFRNGWDAISWSGKRQERGQA